MVLYSLYSIQIKFCFSFLTNSRANFEHDENMLEENAISNVVELMNYQN
jgi:hypothetical protein